MRHDRKPIISGANPIPTGGRVRSRVSSPRRGPHVRACRLIARIVGGSDGGTLATPVRQALGDVASRCATAVRFIKGHEKTRGGFLRAGLMISAMLPLCP